MTDRHPTVATPSRHVDPLAWLRIQATYLACHRRPARLADPRLFTEWVQHRKLHDRDSRMPRLADKLLVKAAVADALGPDWVTPTLWHGTALPAAPRWPLPFVVKSRHGCNQHAFVRTPPADWARLRRRADRWVATRYGGWLDEWLYAHIPPGLLVEPFVGDGGRLPVDYKIFVFGGTPAFVQVHLDRETAHRWIVLDPDWRAPDARTPARARAHARADARADVPARPASLAAMLAAAATLGRGFDFVRADFYEVAGRPRFGEMTFYPGSGLLPLRPAGLDRTMGDLWRAARDCQTPPTRPILRDGQR